MNYIDKELLLTTGSFFLQEYVRLYYDPQPLIHYTNILFEYVLNFIEMNGIADINSTPFSCGLYYTKAVP
jgi:hypothetical protein